MATCLISNEVCNVDCVCRSSGIGACALGSNIEGGYLVYKYGGGAALILAPSGTELLRRWYERADAVNCAQACAACGDWYIPSSRELFEAGSNKQFWDSCGFYYWSDTLTGTESLECAHIMQVCAACFICGHIRTCCGALPRARAVRKVFY